MADNVLRSRRSQALAPTAPDAAALDVRLKHANAIAAAKQALPQSYANNPGAILLAQEWAQTRGVDLLTTIQSVSFISGRPVIDATMQRALAMRAGYEIAIEVDDRSATCELSRDGKVVGRSTYTVDDAKTAGLLGKDNWKKNPKAMLVARATAQTMRWHAPDVMVGVFTEDEIEDPVDTLTPQPNVEVEGQQSIDDMINAEIVEGGATSTAGTAEVVGSVEDNQPDAALPVTDETFAALVKLGELVDPLASDLRAWVESKGWSLKKGELSESQAQEVLAWVERRS